MCEKCKEPIDEELDELLDSDKDSKKVVDIEEAIYYFEPLALNTENLAEDIKFNKDEFNRGVKNASYYAGMYAAYINAGMSNIDAYTLVITEKQIELSTKVAEINSKTAIESSKNQSIMIEKNSL